MSHSAESSSAKVVLMALGANLGIALAKWFGFVMTRSASMAAEAIHSTADCANQVLLLLGGRLSQKAPTKTHPFGYGRESFFWSFIVAVMLLSMGGVFSIYEGIHKFSHQEPLEHPWVGIGILSVSLILESLSYFACLRVVWATNTHGSLWRWVKHTTSSDLLVIFLEDTAALAGLTAALICLSLALYFQNPVFDALGSILVGCILMVLALVLARETKSLLIGEAPTQDYRKTLEAISEEIIPGSNVLALVAQQIGSTQTLIAYKIQPHGIESAQELIRRINAIERKMREKHPEIRWQFAEADDHA